MLISRLTWAILGQINPTPEKIKLNSSNLFKYHFFLDFFVINMRIKSPEVASNPIQQARNSFEDSRIYNMLALSVPIMKIFMALGALIPGDYACISTKQMWLVLMIGHDVFHSYIIWIRLQAATMMNRLGISPASLNANSDNNNHDGNNPNSRDLQMNELGPREGGPQQVDQDDSVRIPIQSSESENMHRARQTQEIMAHKAKAQQLTKLCT